MHHPVAALVGCLGLVGARGPRVTHAAGWLGLPDSALVSTFKKAASECRWCL